MNINLKNMINEIENDDDVIVSTVGKYHLFLTASDSMTDKLSACVAKKTPAPKGKKLEGDEDE